MNAPATPSPGPSPIASRTGAASPVSRTPLYWMALGAFAVGTESFMIAALLPDIARDLGASVQAAGQLVTVFALTYALSSPILTVATATIGRRVLLVGTMAAFVAANLIAAAATTYLGLLAARILLAMTAGLFVPNANAVAGAMVPPEERGRALSIVTSGLSLAIVFGVPLGAVVGTHLGWRMTFLGVAALGVLAIGGLLFGLPAKLGMTAPVATLGARIAALKNPAVRRPLAVTTLWAMGPFTVYPYLASYLQEMVGLDGVAVGGVLLVWGFSAFVGLAVGGRATDRFGADRVVGLCLPHIALALGTLSLPVSTTGRPFAIAIILAAVIVWGFAAWAFYPAQQTRLIAIVGVSNAPVILSVNASFHYFGFSLGAALGSVVLTFGAVQHLGWVGAACVATACLLEFTRGRAPSAPAVEGGAR